MQKPIPPITSPQTALLKVNGLELLTEFNNLLERKPMPRRYVIWIRGALRKYQRDYNAITFTQIDLDKFIRMRGIGPKAMYYLWLVYGMPITWIEHLDKSNRLKKD